MILAGDVRNGTTIEIDGNLFQIIDFMHVKPGKGAAFVRTKMRNIRNGAVLERTFGPSDKIAKATIERRTFQYLYSGGGEWTFMNNETYDQVTLTDAQVGDAKNYLLENMNVDLVEWNGQLIGIELPNTVELVVAETDPGFKGDTATGTTKPAKLETGYTVKVPLFINPGDKLKIDTRSGEYLGRA